MKLPRLIAGQYHPAERRRPRNRRERRVMHGAKRYFHNCALAGAMAKRRTYLVANSLRFRGAQALTRTYATSSMWGFSVWVRRGKLGVVSPILGSYAKWNADDTLTVGTLTTTAKFRDTTKWYHLCTVYNTLAGNWGLRINNVSFGAVSAGAAGVLSNAAWGYDGTNYFDGQMAEPIIYDNNVSDSAATLFGEFDPDSKNWRPKAVAVAAWGPAGCYLGKPWISANLGADSSGQSNNWTPSGFAASDVLTDSPTNVFAVLSAPAANSTGVTLAEGNLRLSRAGASVGTTTSTLALPSSGKWAWKVTRKGSAGSEFVGITTGTLAANTYVGQTTTGWGYNFQLARKYNNGVYSAHGSVVATDQTVEFLWDADTRTLETKYQGGAAITMYSGLAAGTYFPAASVESGGDLAFDFGQAGYVPPAGYKALCTPNLPAPASAAAKQPWKYYSCQLVVTTGSLSTVSFGWNPDPANGGSHTLVRLKNVGSLNSWSWRDTVRGINQALASDTTAAEVTAGTALTLTTSGFTWTPGAGTFIVEAWRVAPEAGFDIVLDTGTGSAKAVAHNNGVKPAFMVRKGRSFAEAWEVYHAALGATKWLELNAATSSTTSSSRWNDTEPTASVFTVAAGAQVNTSGATFVTYVWSEVPGFSRFGSHVASALVDGVFDWLGFVPSQITGKRTDAAYGWALRTAAMDATNPTASYLLLNTNEVQAAGIGCDFLAGGVKERNTGQLTNNGTVAIMAWAKAPLGAAGITPATAR